MRFLIIRHGQSQADLLNVHEGRADFSLTPLGHRQAAQMAAWVAAHFAVDTIYTSPLTRACETAAHLARETGAPVICEALLMERDNGLLAGLDREFAAKRYPIVPDLPPHASVYGQESEFAFRERAEHVLTQLLNDTAPEQTVAVVSHGGLINRLHHAFLRLPLDTDALFPTGDAGIHLWRVENGKRIVQPCATPWETD